MYFVDCSDGIVAHLIEMASRTLVGQCHWEMSGLVAGTRWKVLVRFGQEKRVVHYWREQEMRTGLGKRGKWDERVERQVEQQGWRDAQVHLFGIQGQGQVILILGFQIRDE